MSDAPEHGPPPQDEHDEDADDDGWKGLVREVAVSGAVVLLIAVLLFAVSGVWPPLVAVESDSMEPQIMTGDLVFIMEEHRFTGDGTVEGTGVVPMARAEETGHSAFDRPGDVIIFAPDGDADRTPIIHRAHFWVENGENWYDRTDSTLVGGADDCEELANCPAPNAGFITHGDNNEFYDQAQDDKPPVKAEWIVARASKRIPWVGNLRLVLGDVLAASVLPFTGSHVEP